jgi:orotidine-5'-phosphate decarboxylase
LAELVLALDLPSEAEALELLDQCPGVRWVKVGSVLFTTSGPSLVERLKRRGLQVFLDLKWHDIPNTVRGAVDRARRLGVDLVTVHALGGRGRARRRRRHGPHVSRRGLVR